MGEKLWAGPASEPDRYTLWAVVGGGGEGKVYRATRALPDGDIDVAVKVVLTDRLAQRGMHIDQLAQQWSAQAARLRNLRHPGLVGVQEAFLGPPPHPRGVHAEGRHAYFVMAWVEGREYGSWLADRRGDRLGVLENVADALDELHRAGQVHADVKPGNVLVRSDTLPTGSTHEAGVLVDFGLMRAVTGTAPSEVAFTAGYTAPELWRGAPYSAASDLYGLAGVVLFALTGEHPPAAADARGEAHRRLARFSVPPATGSAVLAALHPDPGQRPAGGCRAWLASARGGLTSTVPSTAPMPAGGSPMPAPVGSPAEPAEGSKRRRLPRIAATVALSVTVTLTVAVVRNYTASGGDTDAAPTTTTEQAATTASTTTTTPPTTGTSTSTTRPLGGPITPGENFLAELDPVGDSWTEDSDLKIDGVGYLHGLRSPTISSCGGVDVKEVEYSIDRRYSTLNVVVGLSDESAFGLPVEVEITGDGTSLWVGSVQVGQPQDLSLDVTGILRVKVSATRQFDRTTGECHSVFAALGDPALE